MRAFHTFGHGSSSSTAKAPDVGPVVSAKVAALQSITEDAPLAAWGLGLPDATIDRTGQVQPFYAQGQFFIADLIPGEGCAVGGGQTNVGYNRFQKSGGGPSGGLPWARIGQDVTINVRVWVSAPDYAGGRPLYAVQAAGGFQQLYWAVAWNAGRLVSEYYVTNQQYGNSRFLGSIAIVPHRWCVLGFKRPADGLSVTFYVDGQEETIPTVPIASWHVSDTLSILSSIGSNEPAWQGNARDMAVFPTLLSKANLDARRAVMLGL
jgi:hypothetical protein